MNEKSKKFIEEIQNNILIGDGAMGTELFKIYGPVHIESLNINSPVHIERLHEDYIAAGSRVIETNSFSANRINLSAYNLESKLKEIISKSVTIAREAAGKADVFIGGSIGPVRMPRGFEEEKVSPSDKQAALSEQALLLIESGVDILIFETFTDINEISNIVSHIRSLSDIPIIAQMAFEEGGRTVNGKYGEAVASRLIKAGADVTGANCGGGASAVINAVSDMRNTGKPLSAYINAGFAESIEGRQMFTAEDSYLAERALQLSRSGVHLIGGCCGTTPNTIRMMANRIRADKTQPVKSYLVSSEPEKKKSSTPEPIVIPKGILVELDPPKNLELNGIKSCTADLVKAGVRYITLADNPLASVRVNNFAVAAMLRQEFGVIPIPHITGRDRNRIALQSAIMAAHCTGIRNLLCVTGDPVRMYHESNTTGVFDVNSVSLVRMTSEFNLGQRLNPENRTSFAIGVAFNPNVRNLEGQMNKLIRKVEAGANFVLTQPVYTTERLEALIEMFTLYKINIPLFCGIMPLTSSKNAEFLHNEVPGIVIPDIIREKLKTLPELADQKKAALEFSLKLTESCLKLNRLFYLITPRNDASFIIPLLNFLKDNNIDLE